MKTTQSLTVFEYLDAHGSTVLPLYAYEKHRFIIIHLNIGQYIQGCTLKRDSRYELDRIGTQVP